MIRTIYRRASTVHLVICLLFLLTAACSEWRAPAPQTQALKILVENDGIYRLSHGQLQEAGFAVETFEASFLRLSEAGVSVPYFLTDNALIFYGLGPQSRYTKHRAYILESGQQGLTIEKASIAVEGGDVITQVPRILHLEQNLEYISDAKMEEGAEPWFWQTIQLQSSISIPFSLGSVGDGAARIEVNLYGTTHNPDVNPDHSVALFVNDAERTTITWDGQKLFTASITLPVGDLHEGQNSLQLQNTPEDYLDIMKLNWIHLVYNSRPVAVADRIEFNGVKGQVALRGFSGQPLIFNVAHPTAPVLLDGWKYEDQAAQVSVDDEMHVIAVGPEGYLDPAAIKPLRSSAWDSAEQQADLIIITTDQLAPGLEPLVEAREQEGLAVVVVPVEEIYDTFGYGDATPDSINRFLTHAYENWQAPRPRYLLLVGEATTDYHGYLNQRPEKPVTTPQNVIPPYLVPVSYSGETVSDARLADVDGDLKPDLAVGRWPVDSVGDVTKLVERTLAYEQGNVRPQALFAADATSQEFATLTERIVEQSQLATDTVEVLHGPTSLELANVWNQGAWLLTYTGHGSLELWGKDEIFSTEAAKKLQNNAASPIVVQLTCLTGLFAHPETKSLSEVLLTQENGPVLIVSATSLTLSTHQEPFAIHFLQALQEPEIHRIGDALQQAKRSLNVEEAGLREISDTFGLLGDPSARIVRP